MSRIAAASRRLAGAEGLVAVLDAAYEGFEELLGCLRAHEDSSDGGFAVFLLSATRVANGRDCLLFAPSIPSRSSPPVPAPDQRRPDGGACVGAGELAGFAELLASKLSEVAGLAVPGRDREACQGGARYAREVAALLDGAGP